MNIKRRLSASVDSDLLEAAEAAVKAGSATSVSAWVNEAFRRQVEHDRRIVAMDEYLAAYESEFGEISAAEIVEATKRSRATAKIVRSGPVARTHKKRSA